jgi:hypothetical protein
MHSYAWACPDHLPRRLCHLQFRRLRRSARFRIRLLRPTERKLGWCIRSIQQLARARLASARLSPGQGSIHPREGSEDRPREVLKIGAPFFRSIELPTFSEIRCASFRKPGPVFLMLQSHELLRRWCHRHPFVVRWQRPEWALAGQC